MYMVACLYSPPINTHSPPSNGSAVALAVYLFSPLGYFILVPHIWLCGLYLYNGQGAAIPLICELQKCPYQRLFSSLPIGTA